MGVIPDLFSSPIQSPRGHRGDVGVQQMNYAEEITSPRYLDREEWLPFVDSIANIRVRSYYPQALTDSDTHRLIFADKLADHGDPREHLVRANTPESHDNRDWSQRVINHSDRIPLQDGSQIEVNTFRNHRGRKAHSASITWTPQSSKFDKWIGKEGNLLGEFDYPVHFGGTFNHSQAREMADRMGPEVGERIHATLDKAFGPRPRQVPVAPPEQPPTQAARYAEPQQSYARKKPQLPRASSNLVALMKGVRQNPYDLNLHGAVADALDEEHPGTPISELIRHQFGLGQYGGQGEKHSNYYEPVNNSWDGSFPYHARLGQHGPFSLFLGHEGNPGQAQNWVVHAVSDLPGSKDTGYSFEVPHEHAHTIPQMFPAARKYIASNPVNWTPDDHQLQVDQFHDQMQQEEDSRPDFDAR